MKLRHDQGLTLVELMVTVAVLAIFLAVAAPNLMQLLLKMRLEGVGNELRTDLQYARSESIRLKQVVSLASAADGSGYSITDSGGNSLKSVTFAAGTSIGLTSGAPVPSVSFDPLRGFATVTGGFTLSAANLTPTLKISTDSLGRVTECANQGKFYGVTNAC